ncbi:MAG: GNAT family N-acetyltransferase [Propionibacteriales bacterium]|nr:GNAT family N-acetyltransferase [Propionibacteriales bacterium]
MKIRPLADADVDAVLELNERSVEATSPLEASALAADSSIVAQALVCEVDGRVAAFALAHAPQSAYRSVNYRWHSERFDDFLYLDRIVVGAEFRRRGVATALYDVLETVAAEHGRMVCEVNSQPPNEASLTFHRGRGYLQIGHLEQPDGHQVVMLEKPL